MGMIRQYELIEAIRAYNPNTDEGLINKAYMFAMRAHTTQRRASGDPYFSHPIEVAKILVDLKMDDATIVTALLHDTIEDTDVTKEDIEREFGTHVASLVNGVTKLTKLELADIADNIAEDQKQAENFRKLLVAIADDIRVLLVKLADRLHNMRTLGYIKKQEKRVRIARETKELYIPLAARIGMQYICEELEDLCFCILNPERRDSIVTHLETLKRNNPDLMNDLESEIHHKLASDGIVNCHISGRLKTPYSIEEKMKKQNIGFEEMADVIAFRVIVKNKKECYQALGIVHQNWAFVPGRFKDYISVQKRNGYQSIHTTVMIQEYKVEIQIRTQKMHDFAQNGVAAHWGYKQQNSVKDMERYGWIRDLIDYMQEGGNALELLEYTKMEIFHDKVFCFTPKGRIIRLPKGATAIDFAYSVHSKIGDHFSAVKINGVRVPIRTCLQNGDTVTIITSEKTYPSSEWSNLAITGKAKSSIRRALRKQEQEQYRKLGRSMIERAFELYRIEMTEEAKVLLKHHAHIASDDDFLLAIGKGDSIRIDKLMQKAFPHHDQHFRDKISASNRPNIPISGMLPGVAVHLQKCCYPLPGDNIVGVTKEKGGIDVHRGDCYTLIDYEDYPELWIDLSWDHQDDTLQKTIYTARIVADISNEPGALGHVATLIGHHKGNISNLTATERTSDYYRFLIDLDVYDLSHLHGILQVLSLSEHISMTQRVAEKNIFDQIS